MIKLKTHTVTKEILRNLWAAPATGKRRDSLLGGVLPSITLTTTFWLLLYHLASVIPRTDSQIALKYILDTVFMLVNNFVILLMVTVYYINAENFVFIFTRLSDFTKFGTPKNVAKLDARVCSLMTLTYWGASFVGILNGIFAIFQTKDCEESNRLLHHRDYCRSPVKMWLPFDVDYFPISLLLVLAQMYILRCCSIIFMVIGYTQLFCMELVTVRLVHLDGMLSRVVFDDSGRRNSQFKVCIDYYKHIKELHRMYFDSIGKIVIGVRMLFGLLSSMCIVTLMMAPQCKSIFIAIFVTSGFVLQQHIGQRIIDKNEILADTMYNLNWYEASSADKKDFLIFLMEMQTPLRYEFSIFGSCSHEEIKEMFKSLYFFLSILINLNILSV